MRIIAGLLLAFACTLATAANPFSTDASDLWWDPDESGWGVNLAQQGDIAFLTLFVYGADGKATWFVADAMQAQKTTTTLSFTGDLFSATGPAFSASTFNPTQVVRTRVGSATFTMVDSANATFTYTVNGTRVAKTVTRQTWRENNSSGVYIGYLGASCGSSITTEESMTFTIAQNFPAFNLSTTSTLGSCGYNGTYTQAGRLGHVDGQFTCTNGRTGTFTLDSIETSPDAVMARLTTRSGACTLTGRFAGIRRN
jgi:hypothetical protein